VTRFNERAVDTGRSDLEDVGRVAGRIRVIQPDADGSGGFGDLVE
jgi:hypothetical protein